MVLHPGADRRHRGNLSLVVAKAIAVPPKKVWANQLRFYYCSSGNYGEFDTRARSAETVRPVRDWSSFAVPNGHFVHRGRCYFAWSRGHFIGTYDTLDDAVESLNLQEHFKTT